MPSRPPASPPWYRDWWGISWCCAARLLPLTRSGISVLPEPPAPCLFGVASVWGLIGLTVAAGIGMGLLGERINGRDVAIGVVLALALGFGLLFLHFYTAFAAQATALLVRQCAGGRCRR